LVIRYRTRLAACQRPFAAGCVLVVSAMTSTLAASAEAQRTEGAIGVSLVVAPPVAAGTVAVTLFRVDRDGIATIRATRTTAPSPSEVVTSRISGSTNASIDEGYGRAPPCGAAPTRCEQDVEYRVTVGRLVEGAPPRDVRIRLELLVVAGT
jgi:hypothetical protein